MLTHEKLKWRCLCNITVDWRTRTETCTMLEKTVIIMIQETFHGMKVHFLLCRKSSSPQSMLWNTPNWTKSIIGFISRRLLVTSVSFYIQCTTLRSQILIWEAIKESWEVHFNQHISFLFWNAKRKNSRKRASTMWGLKITGLVQFQWQFDHFR